MWRVALMLLKLESIEDMAKLAGCAVSGALGSLLLIVMLFAPLAGSVFSHQSSPDSAAAVIQSGAVYAASKGAWNEFNVRNPKLPGNVSIRDLGFGSSDARRINRLLHAIHPGSPLEGKGTLILHVAQANHVDPLLIGGIWQLESQLDTDGLNTPGNGGDMTWPAMQEATELYGCHAGPSSLGHHWGTCPDVDAGIKIWFDYVNNYYGRKHLTNFKDFVTTYNPCSDPQNGAHGFDCGTGYGEKVLNVIRSNVNPPVKVPENTLAYEQRSSESGNWYRYQGEKDSMDGAGNQNANCGPTSTAMAIGWYSGRRVPIRTIRDLIGHPGNTSIMDQVRVLKHYNVPYQLNISDTADIKRALARGSLVEIAGNMGAISPGPDANGASDSPQDKKNGYYSADFNHLFVIEGITPDGKYFVVDDPDVWGSPGQDKYWYSNSRPKGDNRLYRVDEVGNAMSYFGSGVVGIEIPAPALPAK